MKILVAQNITAHKKKNQLTAIIYSLTLGCIIFLLTSATLQIETINALSIIDGADIVIRGASWSNEITLVEDPGRLYPTLVDPVLMQY